METVFLSLLFLCIYFLPGIVASGKKHASETAIWILNLLLGWTLLGWVVALVWANTQKKGDAEPSPNTHVKCPDCAELVLREAKKCKHCGCALTPQ